MTDNEQQWITRALEGDSGAFSNLVERYQKPVFSVCYNCPLCGMGLWMGSPRA